MAWVSGTPINLVVRADPAAAHRIGDTRRFDLAPGNVHLFDADTGRRIQA